MTMNTDNTHNTDVMKQRRILYARLVLTPIIPLMVIGLILTMISRVTIRNSLTTEIQNELKGSAIAIQGCYDSISGSFKRMSSGKVVKGTYTVSGNYALIDKICEDAGVNISLFYGEDLILTTMRGPYNTRITKAALPLAVKIAVLDNDEEYYTESLVISERTYFAYFCPLHDKDGETVGVILAAKYLSNVENTIVNNTVVMTLMAIICIILALVFVGYMDTSVLRSVRGLFREEETVESLKRSNKAKSNFLAQMSHEIRTPINAVLGMDEMILRESTDKTILGYASNIRSSGQALLSIINDILDFSKIESGKLEIIPVQYALSSLLNDTYNMICARAVEKNLKVIVTNDPQIPSQLFGDEVRVRQIIINLLTNAVKYTKEGSVTMAVGWQRLTDKRILLKITVTDTGIGIRKEDQANLFNSFQRVDEQQNRSIEGTGLGLAITKQLIDLMLGSVNVESEYGHGSKFSVVIPQDIVDPTPLGDFATEHATVSETQQYSYKETFTAPDAHILVVDDVLVNLNVFVGLLKNTRIQIDTVQSGMECLEAAVDEKYDVIFLDHMMPHMDGIETLERLKKLEGGVNRDTPVIALTANAILGAKDEYLSKGFTDYLSKPIQSNELEKLLIKYLPKDKVTLSAPEKGSHTGAQPSAEVETTAEPSATDTSADDLTLAALDFLDTKTGLSYCPGIPLYRGILNTFINDERRHDLTAFYEAEDWENYRILVHSIKSNSLYIGALALSEEAKSAELAAKEGRFDDVRAIHPSLVEHYNELLERLISIRNEGKI